MKKYIESLNGKPINVEETRVSSLPLNQLLAGEQYPVDCLVARGAYLPGKESNGENIHNVKHSGLPLKVQIDPNP